MPYYVSSGQVSSGIVLNNDSMYVYYSGTATDTTVNSGGSMYVSSGGTALNVDWTPCVGAVFVAEGAEVTYTDQYNGVYFGSNDILLSSAMTMTSKLVQSGMMYVMDGGSVTSTTVAYSGAVYVSNGGKAVETTVRAGNLYICSGGIADDVTLKCIPFETAPRMYISSGGLARGIYAASDCDVVVASGGSLIDCYALLQGYVYLFGGKADEIRLGSYGALFITSGGTATDVSVTGRLYVSSGAEVYFCSQGYLGEVFVSGGTVYDIICQGNLSIAGGKVISVTANGSIQIGNSGVVNSITINNWGGLSVSSGGTANDAEVNSGGYLTIYSRGSANRIALNSGGTLYIYGGTVDKLTVSSGGYLIVSQGYDGFVDVRNITVAAGGILNCFSWNFDQTFECIESSAIKISDQVAIFDRRLYVWSGGVARDTGIYTGALYVSSGGTASRTTIRGSAHPLGAVTTGVMSVFEGGAVYETTVDLFGALYVDSNAKVSDTTVNSGGSMWVYTGGTTTNTTVNSGGILSISPGVTATNTTVNGGQFVAYKGEVNSTTVNSGGSLSVSGGTAINTTVDDGGSFFIGAYYDTITTTSGVAILTTIDFGGCVITTEQGFLSSTVINSGGCLYASDGTVKDTVVNPGGCIHVSGGTVKDITVSSGGCLYVSSFGEVTGLSIEQGGIVWADANATINFDISKAAPENNALVNMSLIDGDPHYSITVSVNQAEGIYTIANGAEGFDNTITINNTDGAVSDMLSIGCSTMFAGQKYDLNLNSGFLTLTVSCDPEYSTPDDAVKICSAGTVLISSAVMDGMVLLSDDKTMHISSGGTANNTSVSGGSMIVSGGIANSTNVIYSGHLHISSGGTANNTELNHSPFLGLSLYGFSGDLHVSSGGTANSTKVYYGSMIVSGGIANSTTMKSGELHVYSGGTANSTTMNGGELHVSNGGTANSTKVYYGSMIVSGGIANSTTVNSGGRLYVYTGGTANSTTVNSDGRLYVSSGGTASIMFNPWQGMISSSAGAEIIYLERDANVYYGGNYVGIISKGSTVSGIEIPSGRSVKVYSNGTANSTTMKSGELHVYSGGTANSTTMNGGKLHVSNGGTANSTTVNSGGWLDVSSGGTANSTTVNFSGFLFVSSGGTANSTTVNSGGWLYVSSGGTANNTMINSGGSIHVSSGGTVISTTVNSGGWLDVFSGGTALSIVENGGYVNLFYDTDITFVSNTFSGLQLSGRATVHSGTTAVSTTVNSGGSIHVSSGGTANSTTVNSGGRLYVSSGGTALSIVENGGYVDLDLFYDTEITFVSNTFSGLQLSGGATVHSGTTAVSTTVNSRGSLYVYRGGKAISTTVNGGRLYVSSGGTASIIYNPWDGGRIYSAAGAKITYLERDANVYYGGNYEGIISKGNAVSEITILTSHSVLVYSNGTANSTTVYSGGRLDVYSGGTANNTMINSGGSIHVYSGGTASIEFNPLYESNIISDIGAEVTYLERDANVYYGRNNYGVVSKGDILVGISVAASQSMLIYSGGVASDTTVDSGSMILSGGVASDTTVDGGSMVLYGGKVTGKLFTTGGAHISAYEGSIIDFDLTHVSVGDAALVRNLAAIEGSPNYTVTISGTPELGKYVLAGNSSDFDETITVVTEDNTLLGDLKVGEDLRHGDLIYILDNADNTLSLTVTSSDVTAPESPTAYADITSDTAQDVTVTATFSNDSVKKQYRVGGDAWLTYTRGIVFSTNGTVRFRGIDAAGNVSEVASYTVSNIDKVAPVKPTASADITTPTNQNVTVTATFSDDSVRRQYSLDGENFLTYDNGVVMEDNGTVYFRGIDEVGNISEVTCYTVRNIDKIAPVKPTASADIMTPTNQNVRVTATFSDDSARRQYSLDGENFLAYDNGVVMEDNGTVYFRGIDEAGNISDVTEYVVSNIEKASPERVAGDLNADGRADIIMTIDQDGHPADGSTGAWLILMDQTPAWGDLSTRNAGWEIFGTGKTVAGKNTDDVYIKSEGNIIGAWTTNNDGKVTGWETVGEFASDAQVLGLGDFNGNGQSDLLLRAANGAVGCFFTNGQGWNYFQSLGDEWKLCAICDLNGDGRDDVVLKHDAGFAGCWLTQSDGTPMWADLDTLPDGFEIVGAGDFDGDGTDDVLLKNGGYYGAWLVNNGNAAGWMGLGDLGDVAVEQIADFNGDGVADLRIRTAAGDLGAQLVMGEDTLDWHYYGSVGAEWKTGLAALS